jgi:cytochrome P460/putative zinc finger protein
MNCRSVKEVLSLYAGGDVGGAKAERVSTHLQECGDCRQLYESLANNQLLLRSLRTDSVSSSALSTMRQQLFSRLEVVESRLSWWIRLERLFLPEMRRPRFAVAGVALAVIISATLLAQLRHVTANSGDTTLLETEGLMRLPTDYKNWVYVGDATAADGHKKNGFTQKVYMNPTAYAEYKRTGRFPERTVMVLESSQAAGGSGHTSLEASVKDRRFSEGWGFFSFASSSGQLAQKAPAISDSAGCLACHRDRAATDHVFTQFYPVLKAVSELL